MIGTLLAVSVVLALNSACAAGTAGAKSRSKLNATLTGTYIFSVVGGALVQAAGSSTPSLVPSAITGTFILTADGSLSGVANVDIGGLACNAQGPGGIETSVSGACSPLSPLICAGNLGVQTFLPDSTLPPGALKPCVSVSFFGPVNPAPAPAAGLLIAADPDTGHLRMTVQYGLGTVMGLGTLGGSSQQETVLDLTASGWAITGKGAGGEEP